MKTILGSGKQRCVKRLGIFLVAAALIAAMVACAAPPRQYEVTVSSTTGGSVDTPGEGVLTYDEGTVVDLAAVAHEGYEFVNWTGNVGAVADVDSASTTITVNGDYEIMANFVAQYVLTISSTEGGEVAAPGEGTFPYDPGTVVDVVAEAEEGYRFLDWAGDLGSIRDINAASTVITMNGDYTITARFAREIRTWHDLHAIRGNLSGDYLLMNDLDAATAGYAELASETADDGSGWQPIGTLDHAFTGGFDGQGHLIRDMSIHRPGENCVGLFGSVGEGGVIKNLGTTNVAVTGGSLVGGLAGRNCGTVRGSHSTGSVVGDLSVGGLVGLNAIGGLVRNSYSSGSVAGHQEIGGLVGTNYCDTVTCSYSGGKVVGDSRVGGLVGVNFSGTVSYSFWDVNASGMAWSAGGTGKTTAEMQNIATYSGAAWDITAVAPGETNTAYTWNIVDGQAYPFLSWQSVS